MSTVMRPLVGDDTAREFCSVASKLVATVSCLLACKVMDVRRFTLILLVIACVHVPAR